MLGGGLASPFKPLFFSPEAVSSPSIKKLEKKTEEKMAKGRSLPLSFPLPLSTTEAISLPSL
jgi:hypothetical protein